PDSRRPTLTETWSFCRDRKSFNKDRWSLLRRGGAYHRRARGIPTRNKFVDRTHRGCCISDSMRTIIALQQRQIARGTQQFDPWIVRYRKLVQQAGSGLGFARVVPVSSAFRWLVVGSILEFLGDGAVRVS